MQVNFVAGMRRAGRPLRLSVAAATAGCLAGVVSGCASTPQERVARMQADMEQQIVVYGPACARLGYGANTDPWRQCVLQLSMREELRRLGDASPYHGGWGSPYWRGAGYWGPYW